MGKKNVHVAPAGRQWAVKSAGSSTLTSTHRTQHVAEDAGRRIAK